MTKICIFPKCERKCNCKDGYCQAHKEQLSKGQELKPIRKPKLICMFPGCKRRHYRHGLCACHDRQKNKGQELSYIKPNSKYGSGHINVLGYKIISINGKERLEHRVIMENHIRRSLLRSESVHH